MTHPTSEIELMLEDIISDMTPEKVAQNTAKLEPGALLDGTYRIDRLIGQGGMGTVYEALNVKIEHRVAIKIIQRAYARDASTRERFRMEAVAMAKVEHQNVVRIYDGKVQGDGPCYIVMEYVEGETLADMLAREGRLPLATAADICRQILRALSAIHRGVIIHRDLKPGNIMLTQTGGKYRVRICDFGLGKILEPTDNGKARTDLTEVGIVLGTPRYMSPEQCRGSRVSEASDLYAVGVIFFEMLVGQPPFDGGSQESIIRRHLNMPPPTDRLAAHVPESVRAVIGKALAKDTAERFRSAYRMLRALEDSLATRAPVKRSVPRFAIPALLAVIIALGAGMHFTRDRGTLAAVSEEVAVLTTVPSEPQATVAEKAIVQAPSRAVERPQSAPLVKAPDAPVADQEEPAKTWPDDPEALLVLAQTYGDAGDAVSRSEALRRFLSACASKRGRSCSSANLAFARIRLKDG